MVQISSLFVTLAAVSASLAAPARVQKRIAQTTSDSTKKWEAACDAAGGGAQCNTIAVNAFGTLLAAAGNCDQQDSADTMITLAKSLNNDADMIKFAQIFAQQPRNTPNSLAVPYCQSAPTNSELNGLFQCQFQGASETTFVGNLAVGDAGTIPFGMTSAVNPAGSCPANPSGPIADGTQLVDQVSSPGTVSSSSGSSSNSSSSSSSSADTSSAAAVASSAVGAAAASSTSTPTAATSSSSSPSSSSSSFQLSNGQAAQTLNAQFASISASDSCSDGDSACVGGGFAQCSGGTWQVTACAASTQCFALPLVNKAGTSLSCDTQEDAEARIAATGATGGLTGDGSSSSSASAASGVSSTAVTASAAANVAAVTSSAASSAASATSSSASSGFQLTNGQTAQSMNAQFASLSASDSCSDGDSACIGGGFAQCSGGTWQVTACAASTQCFALPLVNSAGTSITCDTQADAESRIAATGATGGIDGSS
ncbi:uncharacterized protein STEHIDRAFT_150134 [Stereum hirsutum FP-91666 SS1]|uniref:uncharacterized protein n=1 Tax=Stereum hirsutum (strain FP-91666) TaxID=721885 RepID=UPI0004449249|nr:uncharacterized protein STEHIDRAFT_150134 [Stereum hirsutum FP-91666 SS1]EIM81086.1 hypothetical protein STEHIDRAFT_150134 [Stereum hirsutum FP-91666 SS1]